MGQRSKLRRFDTISIQPGAACLPPGRRLLKRASFTSVENLKQRILDFIDYLRHANASFTCLMPTHRAVLSHSFIHFNRAVLPLEGNLYTEITAYSRFSLSVTGAFICTMRWHLLTSSGCTHMRWHLATTSTKRWPSRSNGLLPDARFRRKTGYLFPPNSSSFSVKHTMY